MKQIKRHLADKFSFLLFLLFFTLCRSQQSVDKLMPIDQSSEDKSFFKFKTEFIQALNNKDMKIFSTNSLLGIAEKKSAQSVIKSSSLHEDPVLEQTLFHCLLQELG